MIDGSKWLAPPSDRFTSDRKLPMPLIKDWVDPTDRLDASEEKLNVCLVSIVATERTNLPELLCAAEIFYLVLLA